MIGPVALQIIWDRLAGIVNEAAAGLCRAAFSTTLRDAKDFNVVISDRQGNALVQSMLGYPAFMGVMREAVQHCVRELGEESLRPGDVLVCNDPWHTYGHLNDVCVFTPQFHRGRLVGYSGSSGHISDVGGVLRLIEAQDVHEEGLILPPLKLFRAGEQNDDVVRLLRANIRAADTGLGDLFAQVAAGHIVSRRLLELMATERLADFDELSAEIRSRSAAVMRASIGRVPDGTYRSEVHIEGLPRLVTIRATITVDDERLVLDYAGTSAQVPGPTNSPFPHSRAYSLYALQCALDPHQPANEGSADAVEVRIPEGTILNPRYPSAVFFRHLVSHHAPTAIFAALAQAIPDRVPAEGGTPSVSVVLRGTRDDGTPFNEIQLLAAGMGARPGKPGLASTFFPSNVAFGGVEMLEHSCPVVVLGRTLRRGSGGQGRYPGGDGQTIDYEVLPGHSMMASLNAGRFGRPAPGRDGGGEGLLAVATLDGEPIAPYSSFPFEAGKVIHLETAGGAGIGSPLDGEGASTGPRPEE